MAPEKPVGASITLFLKYARVTLLVSLRPNQTLHALKEAAFDALVSRYPDGIEGATLPSSADEISFARPVLPDEENPEAPQEWTPLAGTDKDSMTALELKDAHVLAFRWTDGDWLVEIPAFDDEEEEES